MSNFIPRNKVKASDIWNETQQRVMLAIADTYVPSFEGEEAAQIIASLPKHATDRQRELAPKFAKDGYINNPQLIHDLAFQARSSLSTTTLNQINLVLTLLGTRLGCLAMMGTIGPFDQLDRKTREQCLNRWVQLPIGLLRKAAAGFKGVSLLVWYRFHQPAWEAVGYSDGPSIDWKELAKEEEVEEGFDYKFENEKISSLIKSSSSSEKEEPEITISTEVLIIGSGSGGGVAAQYLTSLGVRVLVVDKGTYLHPKDMKGREDQGYPELYDGGGLLAAEDGSMNVLAGSTFGGGTVVNWSASLKPRHYVREAWSEKHHLPYFRSPLFTNDLNAVCQRMGVETKSIKHNIANSLLALGAQRSGQPVEAVPQNTGGHIHYCGKCQLGCVSGHKQGGTVTWLKDAAKTGKASFIQNCLIERILFEKDEKKKNKKNEAGRAIGAIAIIDGKKVKIDANKAIIVAGGSIQTPAILLRTPELKYNNQIGKRLHLHPTTVVTGFYDFPINPWQGGLLTMVSNGAELVDIEGGWGSKIEVIASSPSVHAAFSPWSNAIEHKADMLKYNHAFELIIICRDRDAGEIFIDDQGIARINYTISKHDQKSLIQGILRACDIHMMAGASKIGTVQTGVSPFIPGITKGSSSISNLIKQPAESVKTLEFSNKDQNAKVLPESTTIPSTATPVEAVPRNLSDPAYVSWRKEVENFGAQPYTIMIGSAHQMGSCRLGATPRTGALDPEGRVWGTKNLYVADASTLPEASGVNPMITTMATARSISRNVAHDLGVELPVNVAIENAARQGKL